MIKKRLTGRSYFKRNWLGALILFIEEEITQNDTNAGMSSTSHTIVSTRFREATEEDLIDFNMVLVAPL